MISHWSFCLALKLKESSTYSVSHWKSIFFYLVSAITDTEMGNTFSMNRTGLVALLSVVAMRNEHVHVHTLGRLVSCLRTLASTLKVHQSPRIE